MNAPPVALGVVTQDVSPEELFQVLTGATSLDPNQIQAASARLKEMLQQAGVFDALHQIAAERSVPLPVRQQASIQFKNEALKSWRSRKIQNDAHRSAIRNRFITFLDEPDDTIADCMQLSVSKVARIDIPDQWPSLIPDLMATIEQGLTQRYANNYDTPESTLKLRRSLQTLRKVLKEFSAMKMLQGVKHMSKIVDQLHEVLHNYYFQISSSLAINSATISNRTYADLLLADLVYKSLSTVAAWLWQKSDKMNQEEANKANAWIYRVFDTSLFKLRELVQWRSMLLSSAAPQPNFIDLITKHIRHLGKFFQRLCQLSPKRFVEIHNCSDLVFFYWEHITQAANAPSGAIDDTNFVLYPVRFLVQGMALLKDTLGQYTAVRRDGTPNKNILSQKFVEDAITLIVTRFLPLNTKDLESWLNDPEEWVNIEETESDHWEYELRACSERVLMQLSNQFPDFVAPFLQVIFQQVAEQTAADLNTTLQKEAVYCALGRCCRRMKDLVPFMPWIEQRLTVEARDTSESAPILKRRIAWVLGKLMSDQCINPNNPKIWEILVYLLGDRGAGTDTVVRLTAAVALREGIDTLEFEMPVFKPFLTSAVSELMKLITEVDSFDSKSRVDNAINVLIERAGSEMIPIVDVVTAPIPGLWMEAGTNWLFKNSLLVTVTNLIKAIGAHSASLSGIVVPLVDESIKEGMNLDGDGVILWKDAVRNTPSGSSGSSPLMTLVPMAIQQLESNLDLLGTLLDIMESYFLLDGVQILQSFSVDLFKAFLSIFTRNAMGENQKGALNALRLLIQLTPSSLWAEPLHVSGLFPYLLKNLIDNEADSLVLTQHIYLFSRIVMVDPHAFLQLMTAAAPAINLTEAKAYELLLDQWWAKFDTMSEPRHRKLVAMGVTALVSTGRPDVLDRLPTEIFNLWLDVFGEIKEARRQPEYDSDGGVNLNTLHRYWEREDAPEEYYRGSEGTPEYERRKQVYENDPVRTTQLSSYVAAGVGAAERICGPDSFQRLYLSKADPTVLKQLQDEMAQ